MGDGFRSVVQTHREVHRFLRAVDGAPPGGEGAVWAERVAWLRRTLAGHFAQEETRGGFLATLERWVADGPLRVADLRREHEALLGEVDRAGRLADAGDPGLEGAVRALAVRLSSHEAIEAELSLACERARRAAGDLGP